MSVSTVNNKMQPLPTTSTSPEYHPADVRQRPIYFEELGEFFKQLREGRGWSQSDAARFARQKKLAGLSRNVLLRLEGGKVKSPEPDVLSAVAALYEVSYDAIVREYVRFRYGLAGPTLSKWGSTVATSATGGSPDAASSHERRHLREIAVLKTRLTRYEIALSQVRDGARQLAKLASVSRQGRTAARRRA